jgi:hypothetical protein
MNNYPDIEKDGMNGTVYVSLDRYEELLDCETRVAVALEYYDKAKFATVDDILMMLGANIKSGAKEDE